MNNDNHSNVIRDFYNKCASNRDQWNRRAWYYHKLLSKLIKFLIPDKESVMEIGCGTGDLLKLVNPSYGLGIDIADQMVAVAGQKYSELKFSTMDAQQMTVQDKFSYIILSDVIGNFEDVQKCFDKLHQVTNENSRVIITSYNHLWEGIIKLMEAVGLKMRQPEQNWLTEADVENFLNLAHFELIKKGKHILLPIYIPWISFLINTYIARLPIIKHFCLVNYFIARQSTNYYHDKEYKVSVIIPARNEAGNIENAVKRIPKLGSHTEIIFVEGGSKDNTRQEIERVIIEQAGKKDIVFIDQVEGVGKGDAVRRGFTQAQGDILMILDADLTVLPEDLPKFYQAIRTRQGEFIMGSRLVYPMENEAMRLLNIIGNKFFSLAFSWLLDQKIKDTLCGTKVIFRDDYLKLAKNRNYFGEFDPFGDYDLIFGAAKLNLKILEIPIHYHARSYGSTNISRFWHGWLLLRMTMFAARKLKFMS